MESMRRLFTAEALLFAALSLRSFFLQGAELNHRTSNIPHQPSLRLEITRNGAFFFFYDNGIKPGNNHKLNIKHVSAAKCLEEAIAFRCPVRSTPTVINNRNKAEKCKHKDHRERNIITEIRHDKMHHSHR